MSSSTVSLTLSEQFTLKPISDMGTGALAARAFPTTRENPIHEHKFMVSGANSVRSPQWLEAVEKGLEALLGLQPNWDSYGSPVISRAALTGALRIAYSVASASTVPPSIVPTSTGGCQLEWHSEQVDIEIEIASSGVVSVFLHDLVTGEVSEGSLDELLSLVSKQVGKLREDSKS